MVPLALLAQLVLTAATVSCEDQLTVRWSEAAYRWLQRDCHHCIQHKSQARLYIAKPQPKGGPGEETSIATEAGDRLRSGPMLEPWEHALAGPSLSAGRLRAIAADGGARQSGHHDAILVIDPSPHLRPGGHPLHMFFVDMGFSREDCEGSAGILLEGGDCLTQWRRARCHRRLPSRRGDGCSLLYLPEVRLSHGSDEDLLVCSELWSTCPRSRHGAQGAGSVCDPLTTNGKGCRAALDPPCVFMSVCHHALIVSGGWNRQIADEESFKNVRKINNMLRKNGFAENNIKIFYGNGLTKSEEELYSNELGDVYPSSLKFALRYHLKSLCEIKHCTNTLFVYLNSPARPDGGALLWDASGNGEYDDTEVYTVKELLRDIGHCRARRLVLVVDQAYAGEVLRLAKKQMVNLKGLIFLSPGAPEESRDSLAKVLGDLAPWQCLTSLSPWTATPGLDNTTLSGGSCELGLSVEPSACQNLSTLEMLQPEQEASQA